MLSLAHAACVYVRSLSHLLTAFIIEIVFAFAFVTISQRLRLAHRWLSFIALALFVFLFIFSVCVRACVVSVIFEF